ncbi:MAG: hypothetical protein KIH01_00810 [Candidatus Freyarchaeota archaeon]|nr:hypothetical protein [Candidatus Jordarchaeia archaeon]
MVSSVAYCRRVPDEIKSLIEYGGSLLVKGMAGSGKTSFALSVLEEFSGGTPVYVSTRLSQESFYRHFPWARGFLGDENFVDARSPRIPPVEGRLPLKYASAPEFVEAVYFKLKDGGEPRIVVIDSLDALKFVLNMPYEDIQLEKLLLEMAEATRSSVVFVAETSGGTPLDYVVDGVVVLRWRLVGGFFLREAVFEKVRGERIAFPVRCFTLKDGLFRLIEPRHYELGEKASPPPVKKISGRVIPTNIDELDEVLGGGLRRGGVIVLDVSVGVGVYYRWIVILPVLNAVMQGCPAVFVPSTGFSHFDVENSFKPFFKEKNLENFIHTIEFAGKGGENAYLVEGEDPVKDAERLLGIADSISKEHSSKDLIMFIGTDTLEHVYGADAAVRMISRVVAASRSRGYTLILVAKHGQLCREALFHMSDAHFKLESVNSVTLIQGVNPPTRIYVLTMGETEGYVKARLMPVE